jgi:hypothetical protein
MPMPKLAVTSGRTFLAPDGNVDGAVHAKKDGAGVRSRTNA